MAQKWLQEAWDTPIHDAHAMTLATATKEGRPSTRMVLLKGFESDALLFYTHYQSRKAEELSENPWASITLFWREWERQMHAEGEVAQVSREESIRYFSLRPRESQIAAWTSNQSSVLANREELEGRWLEIKKEFDGKEVPCPPDWGGYRLRPCRFEFWQGREHRLHDRFQYRKEKGCWIIERLSP